MVSTNVSYQLIAKDLPRSLSLTAKQPLVARESAYYLSKIRDLKTVDDFVKDTRVFNFAMKAFGLEEMSYAKAFMKKALKEGIETEGTFANQLSDKRYRDFVETFNYATFGPITSTFESVGKGVVDKYVRQTLESDAGKSNEGVRLALYFERKASSVTSAFGILADRALTQVVQTAFQIPSASNANIDRQADQIKKKLNIEDLKDPKKVKEIVNRFTALWELDNPSQGSSQSLVSTLFTNNSTRGISASVLQSLQKLKLGGS